MTIEEKAIRAWGETNDPCAAIWITRDGRLINGCMSGHLRDVDHASIGEFFKTSKFHQPGSAWLYIKKFINRGNIRMYLSDRTAYFELAKLPAPAQWRAMGRCFAAARRQDLDIQIERMGRVPGTGKLYSKSQYMEYLSRYAPHLVA